MSRLSMQVAQLPYKTVPVYLPNICISRSLEASISVEDRKRQKCQGVVGVSSWNLDLGCPGRLPTQSDISVEPCRRT